jgi:predicted N-acetyltransferase YhbS
MAALVETAGTVAAPVITIETETPADIAEREALLDRVMGPARFTKSSESLRRGMLPAEGLAFVARDAVGAIVGTIRLWNISAGIDAEGQPVPALLLGPLAIDRAVAGMGIGSALMRHAIGEARRLGHRAILLVGDAPYYARFGFSAERTALLTMPGPFERGRFLALEIENGALDRAVGVLFATGERQFEGGLQAGA